MSESLKGKVAVISGVGSGFAKATAELFAYDPETRQFSPLVSDK